MKIGTCAVSTAAYSKQVNKSEEGSKYQRELSVALKYSSSYEISILTVTGKESIFISDLILQ